jgi:2-keto-3-deoxy-L-rhamnonate aldolase RhmA
MMASFLNRDLAASKRFKAKLRAGEITTLVHSSHPQPSLVERLAQAGFDGVLIDCEHGSVGRERVEEMSRAAALAGTAAILRPEGSLTHLITGYLGCGIDGFMLPLITTPTQAQELLKCFRTSAPIDHAHRVMILMIETIEAVEHLPALLDMESVDAYLVAPYDLALSMGETLSRSRPMSQQVFDTVDRAIATIVKAGKPCGMRVDFDSVESYMDKGVTLLYGHADHMLARGAKEFFGKIDSGKARIESGKRKAG